MGNITPNVPSNVNRIINIDKGIDMMKNDINKIGTISNDLRNIAKNPVHSIKGILGGTPPSYLERRIQPIGTAPIGKLPPSKRRRPRPGPRPRPPTPSLPIVPAVKSRYYSGVYNKWIKSKYKQRGKHYR